MVITGKNVYIEKLDNIVSDYNEVENEAQNKIKVKPKDVTFLIILSILLLWIKGKVIQNEYLYKNFKMQKVRISNGFVLKWTEQSLKLKKLTMMFWRCILLKIWVVI